MTAKRIALEDFGYIAKIGYNLRSEMAVFVRFDKNHKRIGRPQHLDAGRVPILLFQLVEAGYSVWKNEEGYILAASEQHTKDQVSEFELVKRTKDDG